MQREMPQIRKYSIKTCNLASCISTDLTVSEPEESGLAHREVACGKGFSHERRESSFGQFEFFVEGADGFSHGGGVNDEAHAQFRRARRDCDDVDIALCNGTEQPGSDAGSAVHA